MGPLAATAFVTLAGISPVGPVVHTARVNDPGTEWVADSRHTVPLQGSSFGGLPYTPTLLPVGQPGGPFDPADALPADSSRTPPHAWDSRSLLCVAAAEPVGPFGGNAAIEPRPAGPTPDREPRELLWLIAFGLVAGGVAAAQRRLPARSG